ncbi:MAG TPA: toluene-4-monooxygenase system B family protein [Polyangiaceae bacterium]|jgi:hypothetical protein
MIPIYGFLQGDTMGLLLLADENDTAATLAEKLASAAGVRVRPTSELRVLYRGKPMAANMTLECAGIEALDRIDVVGIESC